MPLALHLPANFDAGRHYGTSDLLVVYSTVILYCSTVVLHSIVAPIVCKWGRGVDPEPPPPQNTKVIAADGRTKVAIRIRVYNSIQSILAYQVHDNSLACLVFQLI